MDLVEGGAGESQAAGVDGGEIVVAEEFDDEVGGETRECGGLLESVS